MVNIGVRTSLPAVRVFIEVPSHVFVNFLLKIDSRCAVDSNDFVRADSGIWRYIACGIRDAYVIRNVSNGMVGTLKRGFNQFPGEFGVR